MEASAAVIMAMMIVLRSSNRARLTNSCREDWPKLRVSRTSSGLDIRGDE